MPPMEQVICPISSNKPLNGRQLRTIGAPIRDNRKTNKNSNSFLYLRKKRTIDHHLDGSTGHIGNSIGIRY